MSKRICSVEDCQRDDVKSRGFCGMHYARWLRTGDVGGPGRKNFPAPEFCTVETCDRPADGARGWCFAHYQRMRLVGNVQADIPLQRIRQLSIINSMTEAEIAWIAGWLEGEGCFSSFLNNDIYKTIRIDAKSIDRDVLDHILDVTGVGNISGPQCYPDRQPIWNWGVAVKSDVLALLNLILPLMHKRRSSRIVELMNWAEWSFDHPLEPSKKV